MVSAPTNNTIHTEKPLSKYDRGLQLLADRTRDSKNFDRLHAKLIRLWLRYYPHLTFKDFIATGAWRGLAQ
jgi:hypothetical protein